MIIINRLTQDIGKSKSGNKGVIIIKGHYGTPECRLLEHTFFLKSKPNKLLDTACREKSGQWAMIK